MNRIITLLVVAIPHFVMAQNPVGNWTSIDEKTGKERSVVRIEKALDGTLTGTIERVFPGPGEDADPICDKCEGAEKNQRIIGMTIIKGLKKNGQTWTDGTILDPESGKVYDCRIWLENGKLMVRGYVMFFYRTQEWIRRD